MLLALCLVVITGVAGAAEVFALFGSPTLFVFIGGFIIAESIQKYGLDRRFAFFILAVPGVGSSTTRIIVAFGAITALLSAFVSNTATAAMMMPIATGIVGFLVRVTARTTGREADPRRLRGLLTSTGLAEAMGSSLSDLLGSSRCSASRSSPR